MDKMISEKEIIARKVADRCCRRDILNGSDINNIVEECCEDLQVNIPEIIQCETLTRSFCAFYLRGRPYLIYDSCLMEVLYIYDSIIHNSYIASEKNNINKMLDNIIKNKKQRIIEKALNELMEYNHSFGEFVFDFERIFEIAGI